MIEEELPSASTSVVVKPCLGPLVLAHRGLKQVRFRRLQPVSVLGEHNAIYNGPFAIFASQLCHCQVTDTRLLVNITPRTESYHHQHHHYLHHHLH